MLIDTIIKAKYEIDIDECEAFRILCKTLNMECVLNEDRKFYVKKDEYGDNAVYLNACGEETIYDSRGDLFVALRNVAVNLFPNVLFRNADYIYNKE